MEPVAEMPAPSGGVPSPKPSVRRHALAAAGGVAAVLVLWTALWFYFAGTLKDGIVRWADARRADGWSVQWQSLSVGGFPFAWDARFGQPAATRTGATPPWFWRGPETVTLHYRPWSPRAVDLTAPGTHRLGPDATLAETIVTVGAKAVDSRLELDDGGRPKQLSIAVDDATIAQGTAAPARVGRLRAIIGTVAPGDRGSGPTVDPHIRPTARLEAGIADLELPENARPVLGRTVGRATLTATLMGAILPGTPPEALARWRDDGGTIEIQRLMLGWGPLSITADGTLALDDGLQPQAALSAHVTGYGETVDALQRAGMVKPRAAFIARLALGAMAKPSANGGPPEIAVPVTIQDRKLYVGPAALLVMPRIDWSVK